MCAGVVVDVSGVDILSSKAVSVRNVDGARVEPKLVYTFLAAQEGSLSGTTLSSATRDEQWTDGTNSKLSQTGNWLYRRLDLNGNGTFTDAGDENQSSDATFNVVNELTSRTFTLGGSSTTYSYTYDAVGNLTDDGKDYTYKYDVWGRLKEVKTRGGSPVLKSEYTYNGLGYRIGWHYDADGDRRAATKYAVNPCDGITTVMVTA